MAFLFDLPERSTRDTDKAVLKKSAKSQKKSSATIRGSKGLLGSITSLTTLVSQRLGKYADRYAVIRGVDSLENYISCCIENGIVAIDTETEGLNTMTDKIAGVCLYTPNQKAVYVPINHKDYITGLRIENQLTEAQCAEQMKRLKGLDIIMFNADFDIRVLRHQLGVYLDCTFDCYIAARCLNENESSNRLKDLHNKYCLNGEGDAWTFDSLFKSIVFTNVPINTAYLYAARDPEITYELYEYQKQYLKLNHERPDLQGVANVFYNIEMPCVKIVADMEDAGVVYDTKLQEVLAEKYHKLLEEKEKSCYDCLQEYDEKIHRYRAEHIDCKLDDPLNLASPSQLAILLYDILQVPVVDHKSPRGTGSDILERIDIPLCKNLVEYKKLSKLVSAFIDSLPDFVNPNDGKIHCRFNQYGANTGRMSCQDPNLQQLPSHNKDIRQMFRASDGYVLIGADYS